MHPGPFPRSRPGSPPAGRGGCAGAGRAGGQRPGGNRPGRRLPHPGADRASAAVHGRLLSGAGTPAGPRGDGRPFRQRRRGAAVSGRADMAAGAAHPDRRGGLLPCVLAVPTPLHRRPAGGGRQRHGAGPGGQHPNLCPDPRDRIQTVRGTSQLHPDARAGGLADRRPQQL